MSPNWKTTAMRRHATRPARGSARQIWQSRRNGSTNHTCTGRCTAPTPLPPEEGALLPLVSVSWDGNEAYDSLYSIIHGISFP